MQSPVGQSPIEQVASEPQSMVQSPPAQLSMRQSELPSQVSAQEPPGQLPITQVELLHSIVQSVWQLSMWHELSVQAEWQWPSVQLST